MEQLILYAYQNFQREQFSGLNLKIKRIPIHLTVLFFTAFVCLVVTLLPLCFGWSRWISVGALFFELACSLAFSLSIENFYIKNCRDQMDRYWEYCTSLQKSLTKANIHTREDILELKERLEKRILAIQEEHRTSNAFWVKLGEIIAVPVLLSIITTAISQREKLAEMVADVSLILLAAGILMGLLLLIRGLSRFPQNRKLALMCELCDDLQGILDMERFVKRKEDEA